MFELDAHNTSYEMSKAAKDFLEASFAIIKVGDMEATYIINPGKDTFTSKELDVFMNLGEYAG